jgi:hypothetical protein
MKSPTQNDMISPEITQENCYEDHQVAGIFLFFKTAPPYHTNIWQSNPTMEFSPTSIKENGSTGQERNFASQA